MAIGKKDEPRNWIKSIADGADKVLKFLEGLQNIEKLLKALKAGMKAFTAEMKNDA